jgi:Ser/Thr protein kinase RdoA (MazF antagonist)
MFPIVASILRTDALVDEVLSRYAIGEVLRCRFHARGLNDTYKIETTNNKTCFLRVYRAGWRSQDEISTELEVLLHIAQHMTNVSVPIARIDREVLTVLDCPEGKRWAVLFTAAPGKEIDHKAYTTEQAGLYGEAVATIHRAADSYRGRSERAALDFSLLLERPLTLVLSAISHRAMDVTYVTALADRLRGSVESLTGLDIGFCHGSLHGRNACYANGVFTFFDFDCCGWGYRAYDLSAFPLAFAMRKDVPGRIESVGRAFLESYVRCRPLSDVDVAAIPIFGAIRQFWLMGLYITLADRVGWIGLDDRYFNRQLTIMRQWEENFLVRPGMRWLLTKRR